LVVDSIKDFVLNLLISKLVFSSHSYDKVILVWRRFFGVSISYLLFLNLTGWHCGSIQNNLQWEGVVAAHLWSPA